MRVLLTIQVMDGPAGASLYVRDCALELLRQGHAPVVFSTRLGPLADDLRARTVPVIDRLDKLASTPDIIHGNAPIETMAALLRYPEVPAVFACHAWDNPDAFPPRFARIMRYIAVDDTCRDHLVCQEGIADDRVVVRFNAVDLDRFRRRPALPERPARALVFSNNASEESYLPAVRDACLEHEVELEVVGLGSHRPVDRPEDILGGYDLVFAKARSALEALATGAAVILCDASGLGPLVTSGNVADLRRKNFGRRALDRPIAARLIADEIRNYDAVDAARVTAHIRESEGLAEAVRSLLAVYQDVVDEFRTAPRQEPEAERLALAEFLQAIAKFSNTFYGSERLEAAKREIQMLEQRVRSLSETLRTLPLSLPEREQVRVTGVRAPSAVSPGERFTVTVKLENGSVRFVSGLPPFPIHISYHWLTADRSAAVQFEGLRSELSPILAPGDSRHYRAEVCAPPLAGRYWLRMALVQEQVAWLESSDAGRAADAPVVVAAESTA